MATMVIHWKDKDIPNLEIRNAVFAGGDGSIIKISSGDKEYWFNWQECWLLKSIASHEVISTVFRDAEPCSLQCFLKETTT